VTALPPVSQVTWEQTYRIINSRFPPIALFEDIAADPADWELLARAEAKTNPRLHENIGNLALIPPQRRIGGQGASWVMAPFVHASPDRPGRFHDGTYGVYYSGDRFEVALFETIYHHEKFMRATDQPEGSSTFRELIGAVSARLHDLRGGGFSTYLHPDSYAESQHLAAKLKATGSDGIVYPSVRFEEGEAIAAFYPDVVTPPTQGRHLRYHWDGTRIAYVSDLSNQSVFRVKP